MQNVLEYLAKPKDKMFSFFERANSWVQLDQVLQRIVYVLPDRPQLPLMFIFPLSSSRNLLYIPVFFPASFKPGTGILFQMHSRNVAGEPRRGVNVPGGIPVSCLFYAFRSPTQFSINLGLLICRFSRFFPINYDNLFSIIKF